MRSVVQLCLMLSVLGAAGEAFAQIDLPIATPRASTPMPGRRAAGIAVQCGEIGASAVISEAIRHFETGQSLINAGAWLDAERELRLALSLYDSPNSRYLLGRALLGENRLVEAYNELDGTVGLAARCAQADQLHGRARYEQTIADALQTRDMLAPRVALLSIHVAEPVPPDFEVRVNGRALDRFEWDRPRAVAGETARIEAIATDRAPFVATVAIDAGRSVAIDVVLGAVPAAVVASPRMTRIDRTPALRPVGGIVGAVGLVAAAGGVAMYIVARGMYAGLLAECDGPCAPTIEYATRIDRGESLERLGLIASWAGAGVALVGSVILLAGSGAVDSRRRHTVMVPYVDPTRGIGGIAGVF